MSEFKQIIKYATFNYRTNPDEMESIRSSMEDYSLTQLSDAVTNLVVLDTKVKEVTYELIDGKYSPITSWYILFTGEFEIV